MNNQYKHVGQPFTVEIAEELILELCKGETLKKSEIMNRVCKHHIKQGGLEYAGTKSLGLTFNDALNKNLKQKRGLATNEGTEYGHWTINGDIMNNQYKYTGQPFTVEIAEELILELCKGETLKKSEITDRVYYRHHIEKGGLEYAGKQSLGLTFNDALNKNLKQKRGLATNEGTKHGHWIIKGGTTPDDDPQVEQIKGCVYIYYYPTYKEQAKSKGEDRWPCKIGCTKSPDPKDRIAEQVTGMPEAPQTEVIMHTENPEHIERIIHSILKLKERNRHIQDAPGSEWFLISPDIAKRVAKEFKSFLNRIDI